MKGYRKISSGEINVDVVSMLNNDNYELDCQIRTNIHGSILDHVEKTKGTIGNYLVVVYAKKAGAP